MHGKLDISIGGWQLSCEAFSCERIRNGGKNCYRVFFCHLFPECNSCLTPDVDENKCRKPQPEKFWLLARFKNSCQ
jgi:hypothetical protein